MAASNYTEHLPRSGVAYTVEPVSIRDIEEQRAAIDSQGYAQHVALMPLRVHDE